MRKILVVEDDKNLNRIVCKYLNTYGYETVGCFDAGEAFDTMVETMFDLIISDIMLPEIDGFQFASSVRCEDKTIPIIFMTARDDIMSKQKGYRLGIDDYMVKPIDLEELVLRIEALFRRANIANEKKITVGDLVLDADERMAYVNGEEVPVTVREFNILYKLLSYPKKTFTRVQLMDEFWGYESDSDSRTVDVYMTKIRKKFHECQAFEIVTVHGLGYKAVIR